MKKHPQSRIYLTIILAIFLLAGLGVFVIGDKVSAATAEQWKLCSQRGFKK